MKRWTYPCIIMSLLAISSCSKDTNPADALAGTYRSTDSYTTTIKSREDHSIEISYFNYGIVSQLSGSNDFAFDETDSINGAQERFIGGGQVKDNILTWQMSVTITSGSGTNNHYEHIYSFTGVRVP